MVLRHAVHCDLSYCLCYLSKETYSSLFNIYLFLIFFLQYVLVEANCLDVVTGGMEWFGEVPVNHIVFCVMQALRGYCCLFV